MAVAEASILGGPRGAGPPQYFSKGGPSINRAPSIIQCCFDAECCVTFKNNVLDCSALRATTVSIPGQRADTVTVTAGGWHSASVC